RRDERRVKKIRKKEAIGRAQQAAAVEVAEKEGRGGVSAVAGLKRKSGEEDKEDGDDWKELKREARDKKSRKGNSMFNNDDDSE
ncbi:hypothetical protein HDU98_002580, partial [Podochytrium sp. JEL0797]